MVRIGIETETGCWEARSGLLAPQCWDGPSLVDWAITDCSGDESKAVMTPNHQPSTKCASMYETAAPTYPTCGPDGGLAMLSQ